MAGSNKLLLIFSVILLINLNLIRGQVNYYDVLEAQFLSLDDEVKVSTSNGEKIEKVLTEEVRNSILECWDKKKGSARILFDTERKLFL